MPEIQDRRAAALEQRTLVAASLADHASKILTATAAVIMLLMVVFPRFAPVNAYALALVATLVAFALVSNTYTAALKSNATDFSHPITLASLGFGVWCLVACAWSADPAWGAIKALLYFGMVIAAVSGKSLINTLDRPTLEALGRGILIGLLIGAIYLCIETLTSRGITRFVWQHFDSLRPADPKHIRVVNGTVTKVSDANINRVTAVFVMWLWPAFLLTINLCKDKWRTGVLIGLVLVTSILIVSTRHQTSQIAIAGSTVLFCLTAVSPVAARRLTIGGWIIATALMLPLAITAYNSGLHKSPWLFSTAQQRIIIWGYTAEQAFQRPIIGVGTDATPALDEQRTVKIKPPGYPIALATRAHPHNVYIQVWYELGAIGAFLFGLLGLALIEYIAVMNSRVQPYAMASFITVAAMISSSYGLWQTWFQASIVFSLVALLLAARLTDLNSQRESG